LAWASEAARSAPLGGDIGCLVSSILLPMPVLTHPFWSRYMKSTRPSSGSLKVIQ
jgi:hypothetical protein